MTAIVLNPNMKPSSIPKVFLGCRLASVALLFLLPFYFFYAPVKGNSVVTYGIAFWDAVLHISVLPLVFLTVIIGLLFAVDDKHGSTYYYYEPVPTVERTGRAAMAFCRILLRLLPRAEMCVLGIVLTITVAQSIQSQLQVVYPGWIWNPALWFPGAYRVYSPRNIHKALQHICLERNTSDVKHDPLCLSRAEWNELSSGMLSSRNRIDVETVLRGIKYAKTESGGIVINVLSRDTVDHIQSLRHNIEGLVPFFSNLAVVVFENDSVDGSREAFEQWAKEAKGYKVDLMECDEAPRCRFHESHRYESLEQKDQYFSSSAVGKMPQFRQRIMDYILSQKDYVNFSHVLVIDLDIGVSISPLGVLHSLGLFSDKPVASASRQVWPGSFGTITPPYDFAPFRAVETPQNKPLLDLTEKFCEITPPGDRWRNQCESVSPLHFLLLLALDRSGSEPYEVASAFNGATLYPLKAVRALDAKYDAGTDGQRCEHVGFNLSFRSIGFFVNPKWRMHLSPRRPGGPDGKIAMKNIARIIAIPKISLTIFFGTLMCMIILVYSTMTLFLIVHHSCLKARIKGGKMSKRT